MARETIYPTDAVEWGAKLTLEHIGTADGVRLVNDGRTLIRVRNAGAGSRTLSIPLGVTVDGLSVTPRTRVVPAGETWLIGPFPPGIYNCEPGLLWLDLPTGQEADLRLIAVHVSEWPYLKAELYLLTEAGEPLLTEAANALTQEALNG